LRRKHRQCQIGLPHRRRSQSDNLDEFAEALKLAGRGKKGNSNQAITTGNNDPAGIRQQSQDISREESP
jgi:hypothetical protein